MDRHAAAGAEDTGHLGEGLFGVGNVHEHTFSADCIEGAVREAEGLGVSYFEDHGEIAGGCAAGCFGDQGFAEVHSADETIGADDGGEVKGVGAYATTDV